MKNRFEYVKLDIPKNEYELLGLIAKRDVYFLYHSLDYRKLKREIDNVGENGIKPNTKYKLNNEFGIREVK